LAEAQSFFGKGTGGGDLQEDWIFIPIFLIIFLCVSAALREAFFLNFRGAPATTAAFKPAWRKKNEIFLVLSLCLRHLHCKTLTVEVYFSVNLPVD
jgi:hypothetical protein